MKTAVVTVVRGRATHLRRQLEGLARSHDQPADHVVVAIDDHTVAATVRASGRACRIVDLPCPTARIQVASARNLGAQTAIDSGAELLVFLDVDCIPAPDLIGRYQCAAGVPDHANSLLCGPVTYLPPPGPTGYDVATITASADPHAGRPRPSGDEIVGTSDYQLFWSLSFAVRTPTWTRIGGFCTEYSGYGGEDTDFGQVAKSMSIAMCWVGNAHAFHQFHPVSDPPVEHLSDILVNANVFHRRWGWWPMRGWLEQFQAAGLISRDADGRPRLL
ncbi:glycosyltransferase family 2 protein [Mycolicibacterium hodleri]|uniref:Glycosyltransferase family 2 protein n=1 Tax=Mycolicibacterium hodleri TaxID=49897 RepID=A0A502DS35_9MYCO|nr:galactosyltransferase-related protein [Mycolicibacterium hodleri]TPG27359.1 glycosyltransferase family 2 protein [Mycolicibacterium hodleri]